MKAISEKQPWASLIVHGIKDIENRTWACPKKYIGQRILIHASGSHGKNFKVNLTDQQTNVAFATIAKECMFGSLPFGSIIGSVEIVDCVINHPSIWAEKTENYTIGMNPRIHEAITGKKVIYNWVLANPILFEKPIENVKGRLSFWDYPGIQEVKIDMKLIIPCFIRKNTTDLRKRIEDLGYNPKRGNMPETDNCICVYEDNLYMTFFDLLGNCPICDAICCENEDDFITNISK